MLEGPAVNTFLIVVSAVLGLEDFFVEIAQVVFEPVVLEPFRNLVVCEGQDEEADHLCIHNCF